jgi:1-phosphatidylinositol-3-phosphate 5-kinase
VLLDVPYLYITLQETSLVGSTLVGFRKSLPRLPSVDDAWEETDSEGDEEEEEEEEEAPTTPKLQKPQSINGLPPSAPTTPQITKSAQEFFPAQPPPLSRASTDPSPVPTGVPVSSDSMELLGSLRQTFHRTEQTLYSKLTHTPVASLNDVRRAFISASRGAEKRLLAWQKKHLPGRAKRNVQKLQAPEPEWWDKGCHTAPGCNIVMREDDWGSIIAFTMRSVCFQFLLKPCS